MVTTLLYTLVFVLGTLVLAGMAVTALRMLGIFHIVSSRPRLPRLPRRPWSWV